MTHEFVCHDNILYQSHPAWVRGLKPENEEVMAVISLGYRAENPGTPTHRSLDEVVKFF